MHIEPGIVAEGKIWLSYVTAASAGIYAMNLARRGVESGAAFVMVRSLVATLAVFVSLKSCPIIPSACPKGAHHPGIGHRLILGVAPAAIGLAIGLLLQGLFFAPFDLPQYGMNVTTLLVPLFALTALAC